jgi:hypothetical protein
MSDPKSGPDLLDVEWEFSALLSKGLSRTRATEIVVERVTSRVGEAATVVLVEGLSDQIALEVLAGRLGRNLRGEGVAVVPMGGVTNLGHFLTQFGPQGRTPDWLASMTRPQNAASVEVSSTLVSRPAPVKVGRRHSVSMPPSPIWRTSSFVVSALQVSSK